VLRFFYKDNHTPHHYPHIFTDDIRINQLSEWTKRSENVNGDTFYQDSDGIQKVDKYLYFWELQDWVEPYKGILSANFYR